MRTDEVISVIVPVYNLEKELPGCVRSILAQTYSNLEIILVDDGSTDGSKAVMESLASQDSRIRLLFRENGGVTAARLAGVEASAGEWITFVDGDDEIEPQMYAFLLENAYGEGADISHCGYQMVFPDGRVHFFHNTGNRETQDTPGAIRELLSGEKVEPGLWNKLFRRSLFVDLLSGQRMDLTIQNNEDLLMNYYLFRQAKKSVFEDRCPYHYLVRQASASRRPMNRHRALDPIRVKQIIWEQAEPTWKADAESALLATATHMFCQMTLEGRHRFSEEKKVARETVCAHRGRAKSLPGTTRVLALGVVFAPWAVQLLYPIYARRFQKKIYE